MGAEASSFDRLDRVNSFESILLEISGPRYLSQSPFYGTSLPLNKPRRYSEGAGSRRRTFSNLSTASDSPSLSTTSDCPKRDDDHVKLECHRPPPVQVAPLRIPEDHTNVYKSTAALISRDLFLMPSGNGAKERSVHAVEA